LTGGDSNARNYAPEMVKKYGSMEKANFTVILELDSNPTIGFKRDDLDIASVPTLTVNLTHADRRMDQRSNAT
jgi:hypothetical protein